MSYMTVEGHRGASKRRMRPDPFSEFAKEVLDPFANPSQEIFPTRAERRVRVKKTPGVGEDEGVGFLKKLKKIRKKIHRKLSPVSMIRRAISKKKKKKVKRRDGSEIEVEEGAPIPVDTTVAPTDPSAPVAVATPMPIPGMDPAATYAPPAPGSPAAMPVPQGAPMPAPSYPVSYGPPPPPPSYGGDVEYAPPVHEDTTPSNEAPPEYMQEDGGTQDVPYQAPDDSGGDSNAETFMPGVTAEEGVEGIFDEDGLSGGYLTAPGMGARRGRRNRIRPAGMNKGSSLCPRRARMAPDPFA